MAGMDKIDQEFADMDKIDQEFADIMIKVCKASPDTERQRLILLANAESPYILSEILSQSRITKKMIEMGYGLQESDWPSGNILKKRVYIPLLKEELERRRKKYPIAVFDVKLGVTKGDVLKVLQAAQNTIPNEAVAHACANLNNFPKDIIPFINVARDKEVFIIQNIQTGVVETPTGNDFDLRNAIIVGDYKCSDYTPSSVNDNIQRIVPFAVTGTFDCSKWDKDLFSKIKTFPITKVIDCSDTIDMYEDFANLIDKLPDKLEKLIVSRNFFKYEDVRAMIASEYDDIQEMLKEGGDNTDITGNDLGDMLTFFKRYPNVKVFPNRTSRNERKIDLKTLIEDEIDFYCKQKNRGKTQQQGAPEPAKEEKPEILVKTDSDMDVDDAVQKIKASPTYNFILQDIKSNLETLRSLKELGKYRTAEQILTKFVSDIYDGMKTVSKLRTPQDTQTTEYLSVDDFIDVAQQAIKILDDVIRAAQQTEKDDKNNDQKDKTGKNGQGKNGKKNDKGNGKTNGAPKEQNKRTVWITKGVLKTLQKFKNKTVDYVGEIEKITNAHINQLIKRQIQDATNDGRAIELKLQKNSGPRIYVSNIDDTHMLICAVGDKDSQPTDIVNVRKIAWAYNEMFSELKNVDPGTAQKKLKVSRQTSTFHDTLYNFDTDETRKLLGIEDNTNQGKTSPTDITLDDVKHAESVAQQTDPFQPIAQKGNVPSASAPIQTQKTEDQGSDKTTTKGITISAQELANQLKVAGCDISKNFLVLLIRKFRALFQGYLEVQEEEKYKLKCEPKTRDIARFIRELAKYINDSSAITLKWGTCDQAAGMYYGNSNFNIPRGIIPSDLSVALLTKCIEIQENIDDYKDYVAISGGQYFLNMSKLPEFIEQNLPDFVRIPKGTPEPEQAKDTPSSASEQESQSDDELLTTNQLAEMLGLKNTQAIANAKHNHPEGLNPDWFVRQGTSTKLKRKHLNDFQQWFEGTKKRQAGRKTQESVADTNTSDSVEKPSAVTKTLVKWAKSFERPNSNQPIHPSLMYLVFNTLLQKSSFGGKTMAEAVGYSKETGYRQDEEKYTIVDNNAFRTFVITKIGQLSSIGFVTHEHDIRLSNLSRICEAAQQDPIAYGLNPKKMYFYETGYNGEQRAPEHRYYFVRSNLEEFLSLCYTPNDNALRPEFLHDLANRIGKPITVISAFIDHYKDNEFIKRFAKKHPLTGQLYYFASEVEEFRKFFDEHYNLEYSAQQRVNKAQQKQLEKAQELEQCQKELDEAQWQVEYYEKEERSLNEKIQDIDEQSASIKTQIAGESTDFAKIKEFAETGIELNKKREELIKARNKVKTKLTKARETYNEKETIYNTKKTKFERGQKEVSTLTEALEARKAAEQALKQADEKLNKLLLEEHDSDGK